MIETLAGSGAATKLRIQLHRLALEAMSSTTRSCHHPHRPFSSKRRSRRNVTENKSLKGNKLFSFLGAEKDFVDNPAPSPVEIQEITKNRHRCSSHRRSRMAACFDR
jgi:hypothetical protein